MSLRSIDLPAGWSHDPAYLLAERTNSNSGRERTQTQGANELQSRGVNELKVTARTNSKSRRERTQSRGANELKVAARTNSESRRERLELRRERTRTAARTNAKSRRERTQWEVSFDLVEHETFLSRRNPGRWRSCFGFAEWELFLKACQNPSAHPTALPGRATGLRNGRSPVKIASWFSTRPRL